MHKPIILLVALTLTACDKAPSERSDSATTESSYTRLAAVLAAQPETVKARYKYRHPQGTLEFIGVEPGMVVVEVLPGGGWREWLEKNNDIVFLMY